MSEDEERKQRRKAYYKAYNKAYAATPHGKEARARGQAKAKSSGKQREYAAKYWASPKGLEWIAEKRPAARRRAEAKPERKTYRDTYRKTEARMEADRQHQQRRAALPEVQVLQKAYRARPETRAAIAARNAKRLGLAGPPPPKDVVRQILSRRVCHYCGVGIELAAPRYHPCKATLDHMTPIARGGRNNVENLTAACGRCNCRKNAKTAGEYLALLAVAR